MKVEKFLKAEAERMGGYVYVNGKKLKMIDKLSYPATISAELQRCDESIHARTEANRAMSLRSEVYANR